MFAIRAEARWELAILEGRDPGLIAALHTQIAVLKGESPEACLDERMRQYLESDQLTFDPSDEQEDLGSKLKVMEALRDLAKKQGRETMEVFQLEEQITDLRRRIEYQKKLQQRS